MPLRVGLMGCSSIAQRRFLPAVQQCADFELAFFGSRNVQTAKDLASQFQNATYGSYEDLVKSSNVDLVYVSTPPHHHYTGVLMALEGGKHVICEKPIGTSLAEVTSIRSCAERKSLCVIENYSFLRHPQHSDVKSILKNGGIGNVRNMRVRYSYPMPWVGDIRLSEDLAGGVTNDSLGYPIAIVDHILGQILSVTNSKIMVDSTYNVSTRASATLQLSSGVTSEFVVEMGSYYESTYQVLGEYGTVTTSRAFAVGTDHSVTIQLVNPTGIKVNTYSGIDQFKLFLEDVFRIISTEDTYTEFSRQERIRSVMDQVISNANQH